jgi:Fe-S cluster assembly ATPase SufC
MTQPATLQIEKLEATVEGKPILKGIDLVVRQGETHALMGARTSPNSRPTSARSAACSSRCSTRSRSRASRS